MRFGSELVFPPAGHPGGRVKGAAVRQFCVWMCSEIGPEELRRIYDALPAEYQAALDPHDPAFGILASGWYSGEFVGAVLDAVQADRGRAEVRRFAFDGVEAALNVTLRTVHRAMLRVVASPRLHMRFAQRLWDVHFDGGVVEVTKRSERSVVVAYRDWPSHHPMLCDMCTGSDRVIYGAMGLKDVEVASLTCVDEGAESCSHLVRWAE